MLSGAGDIEKLEADLWAAADNLRANSKLTSSDYFMPVLGVIFLRHAANRFEAATRQIEEDQASGKMPKRKVLPEDYLRRRALWLPESTRYDVIMQQAATSGSDLPKLITDAMTAIEAEFEPLQGVLPKDFGIFETKVLEDLMRLFNSEQIKQATAHDHPGRREDIHSRHPLGSPSPPAVFRAGHGSAGRPGVRLRLGTKRQRRLRCGRVAYVRVPARVLHGRERRQRRAKTLVRPLWSNARTW